MLISKLLLIIGAFIWPLSIGAVPAGIAAIGVNLLVLPIPNLISSFGGRIISEIPCDNGGILIIVGPPKPGQFLIVNGVSKIYKWNSTFPKNWVLGLSNGIKASCNNTYSGETIISIIGTSLIP